jgi:hypothetical protein
MLEYHCGVLRITHNNIGLWPRESDGFVVHTFTSRIPRHNAPRMARDAGDAGGASNIFSFFTIQKHLAFLVFVIVILTNVWFRASHGIGFVSSGSMMQLVHQRNDPRHVIAK